MRGFRYGVTPRDKVARPTAPAGCAPRSTSHLDAPPLPAPSEPCTSHPTPPRRSQSASATCCGRPPASAPTPPPQSRPPMRQKCHLHGYPRRADARRCECQQPLSVAARAHMHSPRPTTSPEHRQMRFPRAPAHYPAIPATDPADFAHVLAPLPQPCPPEKAPPTTNQGQLRQVACVCAAPTHPTNPPATDSRPLTPQPAPQHPTHTQVHLLAHCDDSRCSRVGAPPHKPSPLGLSNSFQLRI